MGNCLGQEDYKIDFENWMLSKILAHCEHIRAENRLNNQETQSELRKLQLQMKKINLCPFYRLQLQFLDKTVVSTLYTVSFSFNIPSRKRLSKCNGY